MSARRRISRRQVLKNLSAAGALAVGARAGAAPREAPARSVGRVPRESELQASLRQRVFATPIIDTHEHLIDPILHGNARRLFALDRREAALRHAEWIRPTPP